MENNINIIICESDKKGKYQGYENFGFDLLM